MELQMIPFSRLPGPEMFTAGYRYPSRAPLTKGFVVFPGEDDDPRGADYFVDPALDWRSWWRSQATFNQRVDTITRQ